MLSLLLAVPSCIYSFGMVSSLHPTSFLMIFILVIIMQPGVFAELVTYIPSIIMSKVKETCTVGDHAHAHFL